MTWVEPLSWLFCNTLCALLWMSPLLQLQANCICGSLAKRSRIIHHLFLSMQCILNTISLTSVRVEIKHTAWIRHSFIYEAHANSTLKKVRSVRRCFERDNTTKICDEINIFDFTCTVTSNILTRKWRNNHGVLQLLQWLPEPKIVADRESIFISQFFLASTSSDCAQ